MDRRFFRAIVAWLSAGVALIADGVVLDLSGVRMWRPECSYRCGEPGVLFPAGAFFVVTGVAALARRARRGPDEPGRHSSY